MYEGGGYVCQGHFSTEDIIRNKNAIRLRKGTIPSIFFVEVVEATENIAEDKCEQCERFKIDYDELVNQMTKANVDSQTEQQKLHHKIEHQHITIKEKSKQIEQLQKQITALKKKNTDLQEKLLIAKTAPDLNVIFCHIVYCFC